MKKTRKEIGSEFWNIPLATSEADELWKNASWFISGRSALEIIISEITQKNRIGRAWLPSWCCDSMILPFLKAKFNVQFYPVYSGMEGLQAVLPDVKKDDVILVMDYFGYANQGCAHITNAVVIRDITHSLFTETHKDADYYFGSLRKWCGIKTGGFAFGLQAPVLPKDKKYFSMRQDAMLAKAEYIAGKRDDKDFLKIFAMAEEHLEICAPASADPEDIRAAHRLDTDLMKSKRRKNASVLLNELADIAVFPTLYNEDCPLFVPILLDADKRDDLRKHLIQNEIYCPVHWPISPYHALTAQEKDIYDRELSLVCDQRYDENDMLRITKTIKNFFQR